MVLALKSLHPVALSRGQPLVAHSLWERTLRCARAGRGLEFRAVFTQAYHGYSSPWKSAERPASELSTSTRAFYDPKKVRTRWNSWVLRLLTCFRWYRIVGKFILREASAKKLVFANRNPDSTSEPNRCRKLWSPNLYLWHQKCLIKLPFWRENPWHSFIKFLGTFFRYVV